MHALRRFLSILGTKEAAWTYGAARIADFNVLLAEITGDCGAIFCCGARFGMMNLALKRGACVTLR